MRISSIDTILRIPVEREKFSWLRRYAPAASSALPLSFNGTQQQLKFLQFSSPVILLNDATVFECRYPISREGTIFVDGINYFLGRIEINGGSRGGDLISKPLICRIEQSISRIASDEIDTAVLIGGRENFGHFLFEFLTKFFLSSNYASENTKYLISDVTPRRFLRFAEFLGIHEKNFIFLPEDRIVSVKNLIVPSVSAFRNPSDGTLNFDRDVFTGMIHKILGFVESKNSSIFSIQEKKSAIWLSRRNENWRKLSNESELIDIFCCYQNISIEDPRQKSPEDQLRLFRTSSILVSILGGSSPMTMFCKPGATVIELTSQKFIGSWGHLVWAALCGFNLYRIEGQPTSEISTQHLEIDRDFIIERTVFLKRLEEIFDQQRISPRS